MTLNEEKCPDGQYYCNDSKKCKPIPKGHHVMPDGKLMKGEKHSVNEVAPPGFGHTKSGKGDKKGVTAAAFDKARKEGRFKGSKSDMFAIMWSQKKKGDKPHYKPGTDKKYKKYQEEGVERFDKLVKTIKNTPDLSKEKTAKLLKVAGKVRGIPEEVSRRRKPSAIRKRKQLDSVMNKYDDLKKKIGAKEKHMEPAVKEMTYQEAIDAGWEMTGEGIWWPPQPETVTEKMSFKSFRGVLDKKKKKEEKKPEKAQDAGAKARRAMKRREHDKYVTGSEDNVPDDIRDHKEYTE